MVFVGNGSWPTSAATVKVPAHPDFVASVRAMARAMAVLADLALEDAEELQMAVDESAILLLPLMDETTDRSDAFLTVSFEVEDGGVSIALSAPCRDDAEVERTGLPWAMLSAIDPEASVQRRDGELAIAVSRRRAGRP